METHYIRGAWKMGQLFELVERGQFSSEDKVVYSGDLLEVLRKAVTDVGLRIPLEKGKP